MTDYVVTKNEAVAQGELRIENVDSIPNGLVPFADEKHNGAFVLSHSEKGNHHLLSSEGVEVLERPDAPPGVRMIFAIVKNPQGARIYQDASNAHGGYQLPPGKYEIVRDREFNPFADEARRVAD